MFDICLQYKYILPKSCVKAQKDNFISNSINCEQHCSETCERKEYIAIISTSNYPSE